MVTRQQAEGDHGTMLPRSFSRSHMQSISGVTLELALSHGGSLIFARGCVSLPAYAYECRFCGPVLMWR
ncbi:MAG: hypothetical protein ACJAXC_003761 [Sulfitobacter sp.]|jgi:hypothetical protein